MQDEIEARINWDEDPSVPVLPIRGNTEDLIEQVRQAKLTVQEAQKLVDTDLSLLADSQKALVVAKNDLAVIVHKLMISLNLE